MSPTDILQSLVELSIAIAGFSGIAAAILTRAKITQRIRFLLTALIWTTFNTTALCVLAMVLLASPLVADVAWSATSLASAMLILIAIAIRFLQWRRGRIEATAGLWLLVIFIVCLAVIQVGNAFVMAEPWVCIAVLATYSFIGFGFFIALLGELVRPYDVN